MKSTLMKVFLVLSLLGSLPCVFFGLVFWSGIVGLDERKLRHDTVQLLRSAGPEHEAKANYVANQEVALQRVGFLLFASGAALLVVSIDGLRRRRKAATPAS